MFVGVRSFSYHVSVLVFFLLSCESVDDFVNDVYRAGSSENKDPKVGKNSFQKTIDFEKGGASFRSFETFIFTRGLL